MKIIAEIKKIVPLLKGKPKLLTKTLSIIPNHFTICGINPKNMKPNINIEINPVKIKPLVSTLYFLK